MNLSFASIAELLGSRSADNTIIDTLLTDSRNLRRPASSLFFAINTPGGNDGHLFIPELYRRGVRHFVVEKLPDDSSAMPDAQFIEVRDTVLGLQRVGAQARKLPAKVTAITGSRGKTTLKECLFQLMEPLYETARSPRSYNSQTGVPLSMWETGPSTQIALIEAGISRPGEMARLEQCIQPDTVILTNITDAHDSGFASRTDKAREKAVLASGPQVKTVIYNADSPELRRAVADLTAPDKVGFSTTTPDADLYVRLLPQTGDKSAIEAVWRGKETFTIHAPVSDNEDLENIAAALAYLLDLGLNPETIAQRFGTLHRIGTRLNVAEGVNGCSIIHDSYTSDWSSLRPAIDFMTRRVAPGRKRTLILSDTMHETAEGAGIYEAVAREVREAGIDRFIGVGPMLSAHAGLFGGDSQFFASTAKLMQSLSPSDFENETVLLKGAPSFRFGTIAEMLEARKHETVLEVNLDALLANYKYFRSKLPEGTGIVAMVKASGYGAGSYEVARTMQDAGAAYLAVAVLDEGIDLRAKGITMPIMVMNPKVVNYRSMFANRLEPEIYSLDMLRDVIREGTKLGVTDYPVHIKLDTGMHRMGFTQPELKEVLAIVNSQGTVRIASLFSHLATADCLDMDGYTQLQLGRFGEMTSELMRGLPYPVKRHVLNTAGILRFPEHHYDMARLGIGLYGADTLPPEVEKPLAVVSALRTVIISIREWEAGETVGYGRRGVLQRKSRIATIPIGYADGMNRHFGRGAVSVRVNGHDAPTVGNICMDACMIDVTGIDCRVGDEVEIFGPEAPLQRLADVLDTIPYEVLTSVSPRVKRIYYRE